MKKQKLNRFKRYTLTGAVLALALLLIGGYMVVLEGKTVLGQKMQDWIWSDQIDSIVANKADFTASVTYADNGTFEFVPSALMKKYEPTASREELAEADQNYGFTLKNLNISTTTSGFFNFENENNPKIDGSFSGRLVNNSKSYEANVDVKLVDQMLFTKYNYNDNVANLASAAGAYSEDSNKNQWVKETDQYAIESFMDSIKGIINTDSSSGITEEQKQILKKNRLFNIKSFKGLETINGKSTMHFKLELRKDKLRSAILENLSQYYSEANGFDEKQAKKLTDAFIRKINIKNYEVWVGATDHKVYKYNFSVGMLSASKSAKMIYQAILKGTFDSDLEETRSHSRDAKRVADIRQIMSGLELYYNDYGNYPNSKAGVPQKMRDYIFQIPTSPTPADGSCTITENTYKYVPSKNGQGYRITFCLGNDIAGLTKGKRVASEAGIDGGTSGDFSNDSTDNKAIMDKAMNIWLSLPFTATLTLSYDVRDYDTDKPVYAPSYYVESAITGIYNTMKVKAAAIFEK